MQTLHLSQKLFHDSHPPSLILISWNSTWIPLPKMKRKKIICWHCQMYLSKMQNIFVRIQKHCIFAKKIGTEALKSVKSSPHPSLGRNSTWKPSSTSIKSGTEHDHFLACQASIYFASSLRFVQIIDIGERGIGALDKKVWPCTYEYWKVKI